MQLFSADAHNIFKKILDYFFDPENMKNYPQVAHNCPHFLVAQISFSVPLKYFPVQLLYNDFAIMYS